MVGMFHGGFLPAGPAAGGGVASLGAPLGTLALPGVPFGGVAVPGGPFGGAAQPTVGAREGQTGRMAAKARQAQRQNTTIRKAPDSGW